VSSSMIVASATFIAHREGVQLLRDWIAGMTPRDCN